ncbi:MAG: response regulator transcription factor [Armatimonadota bacterium]|nr:response regulator transcription factor [Armatimonadota bacterium]
MSELILAIEDEEDVQEAIVAALEASGFRVITAGDGEEGLERLLSERPDLVVLDLMLPKINGMDVCSIIRERSEVPIVMLTALTEEDDRVEGLTRGADDYITKPFRARELAARVRAVLRRSKHWSSRDRELMEIGELHIRPAAREVTLRGERVNLTPKEFELLEYLARNTGRVVTRERLLERVWGEDQYIDPRTLDVHIRWLREKIEEDPSDPQWLLTVRGEGYKLVEP